MAKKKQEKINWRKVIRGLSDEQKIEIYESLSGSPEDSFSYFYLVRCGKYIKIGYAFCFESRFSNLQIGNPLDLKTIFVQKHPQAKDLEKFFHNTFLKKRVRGEWFELSNDDIESIIKFVEDSWK